jgi:sec-independent protein translocase protein TatA
MFGTFPAFSFPGMGEMLILLAIVILLFGPGKIKGLGPALGRSIRGFKEEMNGSDETPLEQAKAEVDAEKAREIDVTPESSAQKVTEAEEA